MIRAFSVTKYQYKYYMIILRCNSKLVFQGTKTFSHKHSISLLDGVCEKTFVPWNPRLLLQRKIVTRESSSNIEVITETIGQFNQQTSSNQCNPMYNPIINIDPHIIERLNTLIQSKNVNNLSREIHSLIPSLSFHSILKYCITQLDHLNYYHIAEELIFRLEKNGYKYEWNDLLLIQSFLIESKHIYFELLRYLLSHNVKFDDNQLYMITNKIISLIPKNSFEYKNNGTSIDKYYKTQSIDSKNIPIYGKRMILFIKILFDHKVLPSQILLIDVLRYYCQINNISQIHYILTLLDDVYGYNVDDNIFQDTLDYLYPVIDSKKLSMIDISYDNLITSYQILHRMIANNRHVNMIQFISILIQLYYYYYNFEMISDASSKFGSSITDPSSKTETLQQDSNLSQYYLNEIIQVLNSNMIIYIPYEYQYEAIRLLYNSNHYDDISQILLNWNRKMIDSIRTPIHGLDILKSLNSNHLFHQYIKDVIRNGWEPSINQLKYAFNVVELRFDNQFINEYLKNNSMINESVLLFYTIIMSLSKYKQYSNANRVYRDGIQSIMNSITLDSGRRINVSDKNMKTNKIWDINGIHDSIDRYLIVLILYELIESACLNDYYHKNETYEILHNHTIHIWESIDNGEYMPNTDTIFKPSIGRLLMNTIQTLSISFTKQSFMPLIAIAKLNATIQYSEQSSVVTKLLDMALIPLRSQKDLKANELITRRLFDRHHIHQLLKSLNTFKAKSINYNINDLVHQIINTCISNEFIDSISVNSFELILDILTSDDVNTSTLNQLIKDLAHQTISNHRQYDQSLSKLYFFTEMAHYNVSTVKMTACESSSVDRLIESSNYCYIVIQAIHICGGYCPLEYLLCIFKKYSEIIQYLDETNQSHLNNIHNLRVRDSSTLDELLNQSTNILKGIISIDKLYEVSNKELELYLLMLMKNNRVTNTIDIFITKPSVLIHRLSSIDVIDFIFHGLFQQSKYSLLTTSFIQFIALYNDINFEICKRLEIWKLFIKSVCILWSEHREPSSNQDPLRYINIAMNAVINKKLNDVLLNILEIIIEELIKNQLYMKIIDVLELISNNARQALSHDIKEYLSTKMKEIESQLKSDGQGANSLNRVLLKRLKVLKSKYNR